MTRTGVFEVVNVDLRFFVFLAEEVVELLEVDLVGQSLGGLPFSAENRLLVLSLRPPQSALHSTDAAFEVETVGVLGVLPPAGARVAQLQMRVRREVLVLRRGF